MFLEPCLGNCSWIRCLTLVYLNLAWEPVLGSLCLGTCSWEAILRNLLLGALPDNLFLGTFSWEPVLGNFACLLQTCSLGPCSGTCFSNFAWEPCLGTCPLEPCLGFCSCFQPCLQLFFDILWNFAVQVVLGKLFLGTWATCPLAWKRFLGPCLGTVFGNRTCKRFLRT